VRNLLLFILILVAVWWVRRALRKPGDGDGARSPQGGRNAPTPDEPEPVIACAYCGVHVPESEGVRSGDDFFCCNEHRRLGVRR
jgi:uncharacterized protein